VAMNLLNTRIDHSRGKYPHGTHMSCILRQKEAGPCLHWNGNRAKARPYVYFPKDRWERQYLTERGLGKNRRYQWVKVGPHRIFWEAFRPEPLPSKMTSKCHCVNPNHWFAGTGRGGRKSLLKPWQIKAIADDTGRWTAEFWAKKYGVSPSTIARARWKIKQNK
jgi:hypothetical protein